MKPIGSLLHHHSQPPTSSASSGLGGGIDTTSPSDAQRTSSVAELRRKAQEHSAALLQSLQHVASFHQHAAASGHLNSLAAAGFNFPLLPPLTLHQALANSRKAEEVATSKEQ